jgi:predicted transcriptional regulator
MTAIHISPSRSAQGTRGPRARKVGRKEALASAAQVFEKWGLPVDYPMAAPNYAKARSELAKELGLRQQRRYTVARSAAGP